MGAAESEERRKEGRKLSGEEGHNFDVFLFIHYPVRSGKTQLANSDLFFRRSVPRFIERML